MIEARGLEKTYALNGDTPVAALRGVSFRIAAGELVAIMGASGSGKSTLLNLLGCLDRPTAGAYLLDGVDAGGLDADARAELRNSKIGFVFQSFNLLARTSAVENVELPLVYGHLPTAEHRTRAEAALRAVGIAELANRLPTQLSGGQQQRVAIARALVFEPRVLLMDEPLSNLDAKLREQMRVELRALQQKLGITTVYVTHDQEEAMALADLIAVMHEGRLLQLAACRSTPARRAGAGGPRA